MNEINKAERDGIHTQGCVCVIECYFFHSVHLFLVLPGGSAGKESACNAGNPRLIPGSGRSSGEGTGYPLQYSWASLVAQMVENPPAMWETWV